MIQNEDLFYGLKSILTQFVDIEHLLSLFVQLNKCENAKDSESKILKVTREQLRKVEKTYYDNPGQFIKGKAYNQDGSPMQVKLKSEPYNPIELE